MTLCSEAIAVNQGDRQARAITIFCRSWSCEICQPRRQRELIRLAKAGNPNTFITLTVNPRYGKNADVRAKDLSHAWREVIKRAKKRYGYDHIPFLAVFEATKRGEPHLHILARVKWIDQAWLSNQMNQIIHAPVVDIRRIKSLKQVAHYIAKYIGKQPHRFDYTKRYWTTRTWRQVKDETTDEPGYWSQIWEIRTTNLDMQEQAWRLMGWQTEHRGGILYGGETLP